MSDFETGKNYFGFSLERKEYISDIRAEGHLFTHEKTGARLFYAKTKDNNKVFFAAFRTPPKNSCGTAHIIEHSVLCGSKKYPVKEPFNELAKGSLNTYLNAMTYSDKTVYPIASTNDKDFDNLKDVYLDAVFNPLIYDREEIFLQEGHHFESDENGSLDVSGVVYNEMKGAYSDPNDALVNAISRGLFKNSPYKYDSGGNPENIPELTYEEFLDFHRKYYHPSNCFFYFYGDMDMEKELKDLQENYLSAYEMGEKAESIGTDESAEEFVKGKYFVSSEEDLKDNCMYAYTKTCGLASDSFEALSVSVLNDILMGNNSSPLKKALIESGICKDTLSWASTDTYEMFITFAGRKCTPEKEDEFYELVEKTLVKVCKNGIDRDLIESTINSQLFYVREEDFGYRPKGLRYGLNMADAWLHGGDPFEALKEKSGLEKLRELGKNGYFEDLIRKYLIENKRVTKTALYPDTEVEKEKDKVYRQKMEDYKNSLSEADLAAIKKKAEDLKEFQETPDEKEDLEKIPIIEIKDIDPNAYKPEYSMIDGGFDGIFVPLETEGMEYVKLMFNLDGISDEEGRWLGFLGNVLGSAPTESYSYETLPIAVDTYTGGVTAGITLFSKKGGPVKKFMVLESKAMEENRERLFEILNEILFTSVFDDTDVMRKILDKKISALENILLVNGHVEAIRRSLEDLSESEHYRGYSMSTDKLIFMRGLRENPDEIADKLKSLAERLFTKANLFVLIGGEEKILPDMKEYVSKIYEKLPEGRKPENADKFEGRGRKTALVAPSIVMYNGAAADYAKAGIEYNGHMDVAVNIVNLQYLWNKVRVVGGAYGCGSAIRKDGFVYFYSYRDPNIDSTFETFAQTGQFLRDFQCDEREMAKFIIGTINSIDKPKTNSDKLQEALRFYMLDVDYAREQKTRGEILSTKIKDINESAKVFETVSGLENICAIGAEMLIDKSKTKFDVKEKLI